MLPRVWPRLWMNKASSCFGCDCSVAEDGFSATDGAAHSAPQRVTGVRADAMPVQQPFFRHSCCSAQIDECEIRVVAGFDCASFYKTKSPCRVRGGCRGNAAERESDIEQHGKRRLDSGDSAPHVAEVRAIFHLRRTG